MKGQVADGQWTVTAENVLNYVLDEMARIRWCCRNLTFAEKSARFEAVISMYRGLANAALLAPEEDAKNDQAEAAIGAIASEEQAPVNVMEAQ